MPPKCRENAKYHKVIMYNLVQAMREIDYWHINQSDIMYAYN